MTVRAKFVCTEITKRRHWSDKDRFLYVAKMTAVTGDSEDNKQFFEATPAGSIDLGSFKEDHFEVGAEYYVDFTKA